VEDHRIARLTEAQRVCLRLVAQGYQYKEIAREIGISPGAVNERIKAAMRTLQLTSRFEAARLLSAHEAPKAYQPLVDQSLGLSAAAFSAAPGVTSSRTGSGGNPEPVGVVQEQQAIFDPAYLMRAPSGPVLPIPTEKRPVNDLAIWQRLAWILAVAVASATAVGILLTSVLTGLETLSRLI
jgi:DNA-binding CsgD family transcriptional regulator